MAAKLKIEKKGDEIKKKSSPLKLLSVWLQLAQWFLRRRFFFKFHPPFFLKKFLQMAKTALFKARKCENLNCISIMMSFLTYITGFFMNFEILTI
jgi:hypothetical protein